MKEQEWLSKLFVNLDYTIPVPIAVPIALGVSCEHYSYHWSIYNCIDVSANL